MRVWFDPQVTSYEALLQVFFREHNPCVRSYKPQYKSAVYYHDEEQRQVITSMITDLETTYGKKIATTVDPVSVWTDAEEYHQQYVAKKRGGW
ncbi:MAG: hypothetical protein WDW38_009317 [Sanguina aurantia]